MPNPKLVRIPAGIHINGNYRREPSREVLNLQEDQERFAIESQVRASKAKESGFFDSEIIPVETEGGVVSEDGCIRPGTNIEALSGLRPVFLSEGL